MYTNDLCHYGTKGMKWYIRLYRNRDGSLTPLGKIRYRYNNSTGSTRKPPKKASGMTDQELRDAISRMSLEKQYSQLYTELHPDRLKRVKRVVADVAENGVKTLMNKAFTSLVESAFNKEEKDAVRDLDKIDVSKMSDSDLKKTLDRLANESRYKELKKSLTEEEKDAVRDLEKIDISKMSDSDLKRMLDRLGNESRYKELKKSLTEEEKDFRNVDDPSSLSNSALKKALDRMNDESRYNALRREVVEKDAKTEFNKDSGSLTDKELASATKRLENLVKYEAYRDKLGK